MPNGASEIIRGLKPKRRGPDRRSIALELKDVVGKHFDVFDVRWDSHTYVFYVNMYDLEYGPKFDALRSTLKKMDYTPKLTQEKGEYVIYVQQNPPMKFKGKVTNLVMFLLTIVSTIWAGAVLWAPFDGYVPDGIPKMIGVLGRPEYLLWGLVYFAFPLLLILGVHELGHYFMARRHNVNASLPFFIPVPPIIGPLGTFGAFISLREPIPNKKALLEIGAAGPIAGFIVAIPVTLIGLYLTAQNPTYAPGIAGLDMIIREPVLFSLFTRIIPIPEGATLHPVAFAGWVGLLVTAFNLLPAGQLDGGHIVRALFGERAKYLSYAVILLLVVLAIWTGFYTWALFAFFILLMGPKHPPPLNDLTPLKNLDKIVGVACAVIMVFCFHPIPISADTTPETVYDLDMSTDCTFKTISADQTALFEINLTNTGNTGDSYHLTYEVMALTSGIMDIDFVAQDITNLTLIDPGSYGSTTMFKGWSIQTPAGNLTQKLDDDETHTLELGVRSGGSLPMGSGLAIRVTAVSSGDETIAEESMHYVKLNSFGFRALNSQGAGVTELITPYTLEISNRGSPGNLTVELSYKIIREDAPTRGWMVDITKDTLTVDADSPGYFNVYVLTPAEVFKGNQLVVRVYATDPATGNTAMTDLTTTIEKTQV